MTRLTELSAKLDNLIEFVGKPKTFSPAEKVLRDIHTRVRNESRLRNKAIQAKGQRWINKRQSTICPGCFHRQVGNPAEVAECTNCGAVL